MNATPRQLWKLFTLTKKDYRDQGLTKEQASDLIEEAIIAKEKAVDEFSEIYGKAHEAGLKAVESLEITPMIVTDVRGNKIDTVADGPCGFAWVNVKPGNSKFANWLKKNNVARPDSYYGGVTIWVSAFNQSMTKKSAYASAFADVLVKNNIKAYSSSRYD